MLDLFKTPELRFRTITVCIVFMATALVYYGLVIGISLRNSMRMVMLTLGTPEKILLKPIES
ncbi:hypothetical protein ANCDUO_27059 [Ancylostoma duodenale]|uniref:Uncharacterized protein n=1 Tax=Ancylostoma duodenale TaxID=51022 RepID=A0A0C2F7S6_9BILA|nr:hypothetical protein ANCDUO_27059 [Ancylostoma duodenale]